MLHVSGQIIQTRVYVTLKLYSIYCYLISVISCADRRLFSDYSRVSLCQTGIILHIILVLYF